MSVAFFPIRGPDGVWPWGYMWYDGINLFGLGRLAVAVWYKSELDYELPEIWPPLTPDEVKLLDEAGFKEENSRE